MPVFFTAAGALFNLNSHCGTLFPCSDKKVPHLMGQHCPVHPLKVNSTATHGEGGERNTCLH